MQDKYNLGVKYEANQKQQLNMTKKFNVWLRPRVIE